MIARNFGVSGAQVGYKVDPTPYNAFKTVLIEEGFGAYVPNPRSDHSALVSVTAKVAGKDCKVIPRKKSKVNGVEVVRVDKHEHYANDYATELHTKVVGTSVHTDNGKDDRMTEEFLRTKAVLTSGAVGSALKEILTKELHGLPSLVDSRRVYVPESSLGRWDKLAARLFGRYDEEGHLVAEGICGGTYEVYRVQVDAEVIRQLKTALEARINEQAIKIVMEISKTDGQGRRTLNAEQLGRRAEDGEAMLKELALYEEVLQETLDGLRKTAETVTGTATAAAFADMAASGLV